MLTISVQGAAKLAVLEALVLEMPLVAFRPCFHAFSSKYVAAVHHLGMNKRTLH